jgi:hypothetical protein
MFSRRHTLATVLAVAAIAASSGAVTAAPMTILADTSVKETPDSNSAAKYVLRAGEVHDVNCGSIEWCFVDTPAGGGYIPAASVGAAASQQPQQPSGGGGGGGGNNNFPGFSLDFNFGNNNPPPRPGRPDFDDDDDFAEVCFFTSSNFRGRSFCVEPGDAADRLPSNVNDAISSIEVTGDAEVEVCTDRNLRGTCSTIRRDTSRLNSRLNDRISSFEVY